MTSAADLARLRARITALEGLGRTAAGGVMPLGLPAVDTMLPGGGVALGGLHDIQPLTAAVEPALAFAAVWLGRLAAQRDRPVLWVTADCEPYAPALAALGLPPSRLVVARPKGRAQLLWAMETALQCSGLAGVAGEVGGLDLTAVRRLQLAAQASGVTALVVNSGEGANNALTRWRVGPAPSAAGGGTWRWRLQLVRCRGRAALGNEWLVEWDAQDQGFVHPAAESPPLYANARATHFG